MREPPTPHVRKLWRLAVAQQGDVLRLFWTWHPKNHGDDLKSRIIYESYPSEDDVQKFFQRRGARVFYDPDPGS
jgi:hypothetical protein